nr:MAG TPA: helix-turn-helix domain protein [Caudoviricetes sp.]
MQNSHLASIILSTGQAKPKPLTILYRADARFYSLCTSQLHSSIFSSDFQARKGELLVNVSKIDQFCKLHGLSRTDLEAAAGLSNGAIGKWERSIYGPSISQLLKLAKYFKVTLNELVVYDEEGGKPE